MTIERLRELRKKLTEIQKPFEDSPLARECAIVDLAAIVDEILTEVGQSPHAQRLWPTSRTTMP
jgi:hypothetical protein